VVGAVLLTGVIAGAVMAQTATPVEPAGALDAIANSYHTASRLWLTRLTSVAQHTFVTLAGIEFAVSGLLWGLKRESLDDIAARFLVKFILVSFLLLLITGFGTWMTPIVDGFAMAGERAIGGLTVSPSRVIDIGMSLAQYIANSFDTWGVVTHFMMAVVSGIAIIVILLAYIVVATQLILTLVESYIVLGGGVLFLGFTAFRATAAYGENFLNYAVNVGIKIFLLYLIVGVGTSVSAGIVRVVQTQPTFSTDLTPLGQVLGLAVIFAIMSVRIPNHVAARITATHSFGVATALRSL
jgi:type IV secretion system protein TrbL